MYVTHRVVGVLIIQGLSGTPELSVAAAHGGATCLQRHQDVRDSSRFCEKSFMLLQIAKVIACEAARKSFQFLSNLAFLPCVGSPWSDCVIVPYDWVLLILYGFKSAGISIINS